MKFQKYAIDFDHTITINGRFPKIGDVRPHADRVIRRLKENGAEIAIWTCRTGEHAMTAYNFLKENNIPFDTFNDTLPSEKEIWGDSGRKIFAECYIDDLSIHAQMQGGIDWLELETYIFEEEQKFIYGSNITGKITANSIKIHPNTPCELCKELRCKCKI